MYLPTIRSWKNFHPIDRWILVKDDPRVTKTAGGLHLPGQLTKAERVMEGSGRVLRMGPRVKELLGDSLKEGDRILYRGFLKDAFHEFEEEDGQRIFLLHAKDALAVLDDKTDIGHFRPAREEKAS